jgi:uncharacterized protein (DUF58 family)
MMNSRLTSLLPEEIRQKLSSVTIRPHIRTQGHLSGLHPSTHTGQSLDFFELRPYVQGEDPSRIDYKFYAKTDRLFVRNFYDETNMSCYLVLDASGSMSYPDEETTKARYASAILSGLAYCLIRQNDAVGLVIASKNHPVFVAPKATASHLKVILEALLSAEVGGKNSVSRVLKELCTIPTRRGVIFVATDLLYDYEQTFKYLEALTAKGNIAVVLHCLSQEEVTFPFQKHTLFVHNEQDEEVLVDARNIKKRYLDALSRFLQAVHDRALRANIVYCKCFMDMPLVDTVVECASMLNSYHSKLRKNWNAFRV